MVTALNERSLLALASEGLLFQVIPEAQDVPLSYIKNLYPELGRKDFTALVYKTPNG
jgi:hypothetical protein